MNADRFSFDSINYVALEPKEWVGLVFDGPHEASADRLMELDEFCGADVATLQRLADALAPSADTNS